MPEVWSTTHSFLGPSVAGFTYSASSRTSRPQPCASFGYRFSELLLPAPVIFRALAVISAFTRAALGSNPFAGTALPLRKYPCSKYWRTSAAIPAPGGVAWRVAAAHVVTPGAHVR